LALLLEHRLLAHCFLPLAAQLLHQEQAALEAQGLLRQDCVAHLRLPVVRVVRQQVRVLVAVAAQVRLMALAVEAAIQQTIPIAVAAAVDLVVMVEMPTLRAVAFLVAVVGCLTVLVVQQQVDLEAVAGLPVRGL
jgi:hypothetical protein